MSLGDYPIMKFVSHKHWNVKSFHVFLDLVNRIQWIFRFSFHTFCHWSRFEDEQISPCRTLSCLERGLKTDHSHTHSLTHSLVLALVTVRITSLRDSSHSHYLAHESQNTSDGLRGLKFIRMEGKCNKTFGSKATLFWEAKILRPSFNAQNR